MAATTLTGARLRELLHYDPDTGVFIRKAFAGGGTRVGEIAGCSKTVSGYVIVGIDYGQHYAHRLAFLWMTDAWPDEADHINGVRSDNRWANLRNVSRVVNQQNARRAQGNNKAGLLGVSPNRKGWSASIAVDGVKRHLGTYPTPEIAHAAYLEAKRALHPGNML